MGFRLAAWYSLVFILSSLALFGLIYFLLAVMLQQHDQEMIESALKLYATRYESEGLEAVQAEIAAGHRESLFVRVADADNRTFLQNVPAEWNEFNFRELETLPPPAEGQWTYLVAMEEELLEDPDRLEVLSQTLPDGSLVQVGRSTEARKDILDYFLNTFAVVMIAVLGLGVAAGTWLASRSLRPVRDLAAALHSTRETANLSARVPVRPTGDEVTELARQFNALLDTIESLVLRMRGALDDIAHDLRTPLTRMRGAAEMALRSNPDEKTYREALGDCLEEAEQVLTMLNALTDISEAEAGTLRLELEEVDLPALVRSVVGVYQYVAEEKEIALDVRLPAELTLRADPRRLRQAVANLLDNALKYTPPGGRVEIEAQQEPSEVVLVVMDTGVGIRPEELPKIWDRLFRGEGSRGQRGLGLGLSLVRAVVRAHQGTVQAQSELGQGSRFLLRLPVAPLGPSIPRAL